MATTNTKTQTLDAEYKALVANALRDDDGEIIATPTDLTWEQVVDNKQTIDQIMAEAAPVGRAGSTAVAEYTSYANECGKFMLLLVSKMPLTQGQTKTSTRNAIPAGSTDWNRSDVMTKAAVNKFFGEIVDQMAVAKWQMATGGKAKDFPFIKSVVAFFEKHRREVLSQELCDLYGIAKGTPHQRVVANLANVENAAKRAHKLLEGVEHYPADFEVARKATEQLDKIITQCELLKAGIVRKINSLTSSEAATGTDG